jgi:hypothetical protein
MTTSQAVPTILRIKRAFLPNTILLRIDRESDYFDLGIEAGNLDLYCQTLIEFVMEAFVTDSRSWTYDSGHVQAIDILSTYEECVARFAFILGRSFDIEKIRDDLIMIYTNLMGALDSQYPRWRQSCPGSFKFRLTPGYYDFLVDV